MNDALLEVRDLRVQYQNFVAVDGVSFALHPGTLLGMIGPNGAGKTTTLRAAAGLQAPTAGTVRVFGKDVFARPTETNQHLGFTPDTPALYETTRVDDFLRFVGRCYGLAGNMLEDRIDFWLEQLWLSEKKKAQMGALSRGMKQRLAVARTLLPDPHIILLDEPAAGLDPAGRVQFRQLLASLRDQGKAIIISSHILADLAECCSHVAIIGGGRLLKYGTIAEVADGNEHGRRDYQVLLAYRVGDLRSRVEEALARLESAVAVRAAERELLVQFDDDPEAASTLLRTLVEQGLPVCTFKPADANLEQAYLRTGIRQVD